MLTKETRQTIRELLDGETFELTDAKGAIRNLLTELDLADRGIERLQKENERYRKALEFYAKEDNYVDGYKEEKIKRQIFYRCLGKPVMTDGGNIARQSLKGA
jgi:predicted transcriptional regulator